MPVRCGAVRCTRRSVFSVAKSAEPARIRCLPREPTSWIVLCRSPYRGVEGLEFTGDVGSSGLVNDFGDAVGGEFADAAAYLVGRAGQGGLADGIPTARRPRGGVGVVEGDKVLVVHREVTVLRWALVDDVEPHIPGRQCSDVAAEF